MLSTSLARAGKVGRLLGEMARNPSIATELPNWVRERKRTTMELRRPWWPYRATAAVAQRLPDDATVLEYGGGGSTLWLHDRGARVTCIEHDTAWHDELRRTLPADVTLILREPTADGSMTSEAEPGRFFDQYAAAASDLPDAAFDLAIIDGRVRVACGLAAMGKVKPGGLLLLDDSHRERYRPLIEALDGWSRQDYRGLKPGGGVVHQTSVWTRPTF